MLRLSLGRLVLASLLGLAPAAAHAGAQIEEALAANVQNSLHRSVSDYPAPHLVFATDVEGWAWLADMSSRLAAKIPDWPTRRDFLVTVQYEASRAGLDPQLVLGLIQQESNFRKYAMSSAGARGYMQVMPFWLRQIGTPEHDLFTLRTNLRYGCTILRYYLDLENGDLYRALGRYNGSLGRADYPSAVRASMQRWLWSPAPASGGGPATTRVGVNISQ
ncbi:MAG: lytic transglycosylase domain-containing protein [Betaproteobacteria bacterium]|nr:MAG: lytic transglycosylase domain-containing protein [Betaproteobacteria bacterium]TMH22332.1 MAG: lytic transglycosylase domain-containing protein [Betaproteobacteria bacterium]